MNHEISRPPRLELGWLRSAETHAIAERLRHAAEARARLRKLRRSRSKEKRKRG